MSELNLIKMVRAEGFLEQFWKTLHEAREEEPAKTQREVYEYLEQCYVNLYECRRFPSYEAFRKFMERNYRKGQMSQGRED